ncbi:hypothetical protein Ait01nite_023070 [Actinoplanes italicus]|uniref:Uncharacterized protein n=1 Tax=Actinoplanes italicus TaxID=113567 RepID=A0A2T0KNJ6_9ACTN|nr:hypothetical protein [Actinoplanes italicus]PRX25299.1 hypothetical protein CLV67_10111 [Actinoplanes italicus]GIE29262.1 hypothetical protein Ait01nite_023070 [Actinoplanes italicus]
MSYQGRSRGEQQLVEQLLIHLQREADDERLRDLASDVLGGRLSLREAMASSVYTEAVAPAMNEYSERYTAMDQKDRDTEAQRAGAIVRKLEEADQSQ